uniref:BLVR domain-containing protein n=1 Tax=Steinernema glaseri TaxID=37863 RepID=A0A1I7Z8S6_9BILA
MAVADDGAPIDEAVKPSSTKTAESPPDTESSTSKKRAPNAMKVNLEKLESTSKERSKKRKKDKKKRRTEENISGEDEKKKRRSARKKRDKKSEPNEYGESLETCTERDWHSADPAYNSELINLKKKANKVTVFSATAKDVLPRNKNKQRGSTSPKTMTRSSSNVEELTNITNVEINVDPNAPLSSEKILEAKADAIGKLVAGVVKMYLKDRRKDAVELEVRLHTKDGVTVDITQAVTSSGPGEAAPGAGASSSPAVASK